MKLLTYPGKDGTGNVAIEITPAEVRGIVEVMNRASDARFLTDEEQIVANRLSAIMDDMYTMGPMRRGHA